MAVMAKGSVRKPTAREEELTDNRPWLKEGPECTCDLMAHPCEVHDTEHPDVVRGPDWSPYCTCGHRQSAHRKGGDECNLCGANGEGENASPNCARFESVTDRDAREAYESKD